MNTDKNKKRFGGEPWDSGLGAGVASLDALALHGSDLFFIRVHPCSSVVDSIFFWFFENFQKAPVIKAVQHLFQNGVLQGNTGIHLPSDKLSTKEKSKDEMNRDEGDEGDKNRKKSVFLYPLHPCFYNFFFFSVIKSRPWAILKTLIAVPLPLALVPLHKPCFTQNLVEPMFNNRSC